MQKTNFLNFSFDSSTFISSAISQKVISYKPLCMKIKTQFDQKRTTTTWMKLIDFGIGPIWNEIVCSWYLGRLLLLPTTIAFLAEFVPNSFKNQSNDEISIEKLDSNLSSYQKDYLHPENFHSKSKMCQLKNAFFKKWQDDDRTTWW